MEVSKELSQFIIDQYLEVNEMLTVKISDFEYLVNLITRNTENFDNPDELLKIIDDILSYNGFVVE